MHRALSSLKQYSTTVHIEQQQINIAALLAAIKSCSSTRDIEKGKQVHLEAVECGGDTNIFVANSLVNMYAKCGCMSHAQGVFETMRTHDIVSWNCLMMGYAENGEGHKSLELFQKIISRGVNVAPNTRTFLAATKACACLSVTEEPTVVTGKRVRVCSLENGMRIHSQAVRYGCDTEVYVSSSLIDMYAKCGSMYDACVAFERTQAHNVVLWNALLMGYVETDEGEVALDKFQYMNCEPDARTFVAVLNACVNMVAVEEAQMELHGRELKLRCLEKGMNIHSQAIVYGFDMEIFVTSALIDMYGKCGSVLDARMVFDTIEQHDVVSWTSMVMGYVENGEEHLALELYEHMRLPPNSRTYVAALKACIGVGSREGKPYTKCLEKGIDIHMEASESGLDKEVFLSNALIDMYRTCGSMHHAQKVFERVETPNTDSWNSMILGYVENGEAEPAVHLFERMDTSKADTQTFVAALKACSSLATTEVGNALKKGFVIHAKARRYRHDLHGYVTNMLMDMYVKCGSMWDARRVFDSLVSFKDVVSWNIVLLGYVECGEAPLALELFKRVSEYVLPDSRTYSAVLKACSCLAMKEDGQEVSQQLVKMNSLEKGMEIHSRSGILDAYMSSSLIDMYAKCGCMFDAREVFDKMASHNMVCLTALLTGYAENGEGQVALDMYSCIEFPADAQIFVALLKSAVTLEVGNGICFDILRTGFESEVIIEATLIDCYGKWGSICNAQRVFDCAKGHKEVVVWNALFGGYARQGDIENVYKMFDMMSEEGVRQNSITFVLLLTCCSHAGEIETGKWYFKRMRSVYGVECALQHYHCVLDLLARANRLDEAIQVINEMPFEANGVTWRILLAACRKWKNVAAGKSAFESLEKLAKTDSAAYVLMSNICKEHNKRLYE